MDSISRNLNDGAHSVEAYQVPNPQLTRIEKNKASIFKDLERVIQCNLKIGSASLLKNSLISHFILLCKNLLKPQSAQENEEMQRINSLFPAEGKMAETANEANNIYLQAQEDTNIVACLDKALHQCREDKNTYCEYLIRRLFVSLVLSGDIISTEAVQRALDLEWDHLSSYALFTEFPEDDQKKYDHHLENYLELLSKQFGFQLVGNESIREKLESTLKNLMQVANSNEIQPEASIMIRRHQAFLKSRPEWLLYNNCANARILLIEASLLEKNKDIKDQIELDLISLELSQLKCGKNPSNDKLRNLLSRTLTLKVNKNLSATDQFLASCLEVKIYEMLAKNKDDPNQLVATIKSKLVDAIEQGNKNRSQLNFKAICSLAECRFTLGFYSSLCCKDAEEYEKGRQLLLSLSNEFDVETKIKEVAKQLYEYLKEANPVKDCSSVDHNKLVILERFKLFIFQDIHAFYRSFITDGNDGIKFNVPIELCTGKSNGAKVDSFLSNEKLLMERCQNNFAGYILNNDLNSASELLSSCFGFYYLNAEKKFKEIYYFRKSIRSDSINDSKNFIRFLKLTTNSPFTFSLSFDCDAIREFVNVGITVPLIECFLAQEEFLFLDREKKTVIKLSNNENNSEDVVIAFSLREFYQIYKTVFNEIITYLGNPAYVGPINNIICAYTSCLINSKLLRDLFSSDLSHISKNERNEIQQLRHHVPTLLLACDLAIDMYNFAEYHLSDPNECEFYYEQAEHAVIIGIQVSKTKSDKSAWSQIGVQISRKHYESNYHRVSNESSENHLLSFLHFVALEATFLEDREEGLSLSEDLFSSFPDTFNELVAIVFESNREIINRPRKTIDHFVILALLKCKNLIYNQKIEQGFALFQELSNRFLEWNRPKNIKNVNLSKLAFGPRSNIINPARLCYDTKNDIIFGGPKRDGAFYSGQESAEDKSPSSIKQEVMLNVKNKLQRILDKQGKKKSRIPASSSMTVPNTVSTSVPIVDAPSEPTIKYIGKKKMAIFNRLWEQKNESQTGAWETRSYMNNVKITWKEALSLIIALGGSYDPERGHGSHHVAHLPRIAFNGKDMGGLLNYETGELITLKNDELLDFYQIIQLRRILLSQGYNPDTVKIKDSY